MQKLVSIGAAFGALTLLVGCGPGGITGAAKYVNTSTVEPSQVKAGVLKGCNFSADGIAIAEMISASPYITTAGALADVICNAVTSIPFADGPGDRKPRVHGVVVKGYFLKTK